MSRAPRVKALAAVAAVCGSVGVAGSGPGIAAADQQWRALHPAPTTRAEVAAERIGMRIFATAGFIEPYVDMVRRLDVYDIETDTWSTAAEPPVALNHTAAAVHDGKLYLVGGYMGDFPTFIRGDGLAVAILLEYDPASDSWRELTPPPTKRGAAAAGVIGDELYVAGGWNSTEGDLARLEIYNFGTGLWRRGPDMQFARNHVVGTAAGGKFYALGGHTELFIREEVFPYAERYDPVQNRWERLADLAHPRSGAGVADVGDRVVVFGGEAQSEMVPSTELFDPRTGRWSALPDMLTPRHAHGDASFGRRVYAIQGGGQLRAGADSAALEALDVPPPAATRGSAPRLRVSVRPRRVRSGARVRYRFHVSVRRGGRTRSVRGAIVRFVGRELRTDRRGRVAHVRRLHEPGPHPVRARKAGHRSGTATIRVVAARRR